MQIKLDAGQIEAFYHDEFVTSQMRNFEALVTDRDLKPAVVVDIGGGVGHFAFALSKSPDIGSVRVIDMDPKTQTVRWAVEHAAELGCNPSRVAVGGDSAGANLATVVAQLGVVALKYQLLIYPVTDARQISASYTEFNDGPFLTRASMSWFIDHYLAGPTGSVDDPRVSPILATTEALANCPPGLVITAGYDPLRDEGEAYGTLLNGAGVATSVTRYDGMFHGFVSMAEQLDDGKMALAQAGRALALALAH